MSKFALYIHIPFCSFKCPYCDFNTYAVKQIPEAEYVKALLKECEFRISQPAWKASSLQSVYFGGGTPSLLSANSIDRILSLIVARLPVDDFLEVTIEANPAEINYEKLQAYKSVGVDRLSFGAQSLLEKNLKILGRKHVPQDVLEALDLADSAGFTNINLDLMYGIPEQSLSSLEADLKLYTEYAPKHISAYNLTLEEGTPFYQRYKKGLLKMPTTELVVDMMDLVCDFLTADQYHWYEISNFAQTGFESRHNLGYWNYDNYLGLGAGAHSFTRNLVTPSRWANIAKPNEYISAITNKAYAEAWVEELSLEESIFEFLFLGLRKITGVSLKQFRNLFSMNIEQVYPALISVLVSEGFLEYEDDFLKLTQRGVKVADSVIENFSEPEGPLFGKRLLIEDYEQRKYYYGSTESLPSEYSAPIE